MRTRANGIALPRSHPLFDTRNQFSIKVIERTHHTSSWLRYMRVNHGCLKAAMSDQKLKYSNFHATCE
jgi:hypothetical protein